MSTSSSPEPVHMLPYMATGDLIRKRDIEDVIKLRTLRWGDYSVLSW